MHAIHTQIQCMHAIHIQIQCMYSLQYHACNTHSNSLIFSCLSDKHNCMLNVTSRLAVRLQNLPNGNVDWADSKPQCTRQSLNISDFLSSCSAFLMKFLAEEFESLSDLQPFVPKHQSPHPVQKSAVIPMKFLFKDKKYISETVDILL